MDMLINESIVRNFTWAQWDPVVQAIYYIHLKPSSRNLFDRDDKDRGLSPTLSAYQFNDDLPTETVVSTMCALYDYFVEFESKLQIS